MKLRIDKLLSDMGIGTRSEVKTYIRKGLVSVNGSVVRNESVKTDSEHDDIEFDGKKIVYSEYEYYVINKPAGVVSATEDKRDRTVVDLIESSRKDLFPVGRLDKDTEGLLIITNDGELAHRLLSPKKHVDKTYFVRVKGILTNEHAKLIAGGLRVDDEFTALPATLNIAKASDGFSEAEITIHEGKFHQIKRMMSAVGCEVVYLKRLSMGSLALPETMQPGQYRKLTQTEINNLKES